MRDKEGSMYARVVDTHGKELYLDSNEMMSAIVGFSDGMKKGSDELVQVQNKGKFDEVVKSKVQYWIPAGSDMYTASTNLVPFYDCNHPGRLTMEGKAIPQSLSLKDRDEPYVQTVDHNGTPYGKKMAKIFSSTFPANGKIVKVDDKAVEVKPLDGSKNYTVKLVDNLPYNQKGFHDDEKCHWKVGDVVKEGDTVAENNYTKNGTLALGKNLHVGYMAYKGFNNEDGIIMSRGACESMVSNHAYKETYTTNKLTVMDFQKFKSQFSAKYKPEQLVGFDQKGLPKKGRELHHGDPISLIMEERTVSATDKALGQLHKSLVNPYRDSSIIWEHHEKGVITDVQFTGKELRILIRAEKPLGMGDKVTGLHGNKGVVSLILEDHEMPHSKETGKPLDMLLNPASVTSRINLGQIMETAAGKIAQKTGQPYYIQNYSKKKRSSRLEKRT